MRRQPAAAVRTLLGLRHGEPPARLVDRGDARPRGSQRGIAGERRAPAQNGRPNTSGGGVALGPLVPGMSFGRRYHIKRLLGMGGMGAVYQAWDTELGIDVAIKLIRPDIIGEPAVAAEIQRRFKRELLLARLVSHQNVVRIHDLGEIEGLKYITMSFVDGTDLATLLARETRLPVRRALRIARRICAGLVAAHTAGVVHRDLKPANVMVGTGDDALITDFGIARLLGDRPGPRGIGPDAAAPGNSLDPHHADLTRAGSMVGTVEYMPPEQARGEQVDQRADVYALGLMLHDMLSGRIRQTRSPSALDELKARGERRPLPFTRRCPRSRRRSTRSSPGAPIQLRQSASGARRSWPRRWPASTTTGSPCRCGAPSGSAARRWPRWWCSAASPAPGGGPAPGPPRRPTPR